LFLSQPEVESVFTTAGGFIFGRTESQSSHYSGVYLQRFDDVGSWIVEGILFCLREIPKRPLLAQFVAPQDLGTTGRMVLTSERMLAIGSEILRPMFEPAQREGLLHRDLQLDALIEWVLRILMSYLAVPGPSSRSEQELRTLLRSMLLPAVLVDGGKPGA